MIETSAWIAPHVRISCCNYTSGGKFKLNLPIGKIQIEFAIWQKFVHPFENFEHPTPPPHFRGCESDQITTPRTLQC